MQHGSQGSCPVVPRVQHVAIGLEIGENGATCKWPGILVAPPTAFQTPSSRIPPHQLQSPPGTPFPKDFKKICGNIFKRLLRVFCHVYILHFDKITGLRFFLFFHSFLFYAVACPCLFPALLLCFQRSLS